MNIIKYFVLGCILGICSYLGRIKAKSFEDRVNELNKFQNALVMFKTQLEFTYEPLKNIFEDISNVIYKNVDNIFFRTIQEENNIYDSWCEAVNSESQLLKEDKEIIKMLGKLLGKTDIAGQVSEINLSMKLVEKQLQEAEKEKNKNVKLYKNLGIILGMGICIILI